MITLKAVLITVVFVALASISWAQGDSIPFSQPYIVNTGLNPHTIVCADYDLDGNQDIAVGHSSTFDSIAIYRNIGQGTFSSPTYYWQGETGGPGSLDSLAA
jgi:hypothetical protein